MKTMSKTLRNLSKVALFFVGVTSANAPDSTLLAKVGELCVKGGQVLTNAPMNLAKGFQVICNECPAISTNVTQLECAKIAAESAKECALIAAESAKECATIAANATIEVAELGLQAAKVTADGAVAVAQTLAPYIPVICATIVVVVVVVAVAYVVTQEIKHRQVATARVACAG